VHFGGRYAHRPDCGIIAGNGFGSTGSDRSTAGFFGELEARQRSVLAEASRRGDVEDRAPRSGAGRGNGLEGTERAARGAESKSIGADGDEFHSIAVWRDATLVFDISEIEDGKRLKSTEIRSLTDGGRSLQRVRWTEKAGEQTPIYVRTRPQ